MKHAKRLAADPGVLDLDRILAGPLKNRVELIGVELEGAWKKLPTGIAALERDGSVFPDMARDLAREYPYKGEIVSDAIAVAGVSYWMKRHYPDLVNHTCGLHVHMTFTDGNVEHYGRLMEVEFQNTMLHYLGVWAKKEGLPNDHPIWKRLAGESEFCTKKFWPDKQVVAKTKNYGHDRDGHRYTAVNYCFGLHDRGTLEVRVLPMMTTAEQGIRAVMEVIKISNACLVVSGSKRDVIEATVPLDVDDHTEVVTIAI